jgi:methionyl-tRNA formyltransferase
MLEAKKIRIIFFGTPEIAAIELEYLVKEGYNIVAVVTNVDKPQGRGKKIGFSQVKEMALRFSLPILQPKSMKSEEFINELKSYNADLQIVVAFRMMPKEVYSMPKMGTFNLHTSLLPKYRGAAPINWAIINGEKQTGITTFLLNDKIDCGEILLQKEIEIKQDTTFETLYDEMAEKGKKLVIDTISLLCQENYHTIPQKEVENVPAPKIFKEDTYINWHQNGEKIVNFVRGLSPIPSAKAIFCEITSDKEYEFKIFAVKFNENNEKKVVGNFWIEQGKEIFVQCNNGKLQLIDLQLSGKKRMSDFELAKGLRIEGELKEKIKKN